MDRSSIQVEIAPGELIDKITILQIKSERMTNAEKLRNVRIELDCLTESRDKAITSSRQLDSLTQQLKQVNEALWDIEDNIRRCEQQHDFGDAFVQLARSVYQHNDQRAAVKKQVNLLLGSHLVEEKEYVEYGERNAAGASMNAA